MFAIQDKKYISAIKSSPKTKLIKLIISIYKKIKFIAKHEFSNPTNSTYMIRKIYLLERINSLFDEYFSNLSQHPEMINLKDSVSEFSQK